MNSNFDAFVESFHQRTLTRVAQFEKSLDQIQARLDKQASTRRNASPAAQAMPLPPSTYQETPRPRDRRRSRGRVKGVLRS